MMPFSVVHEGPRVTQTAALFHLQNLDSQIDAINKRLAEIDRLLSQNEALRSAQAAVASISETRQHWQTRLTNLELERRQLKEEADSIEEHLYSGRVQNPRELSDLQEKLHELQRRHDNLEEPAIEAMLEVEDSTARLAQAQEALARVNAEQADIVGSLSREQEQLAQQLPGLREQAAQARSAIHPPHLRLYDRLRSRPGGVAVAEISPNLECSACGVEITSSMDQQVRHGEVLTCPTCGRILYAP